MVSKQNLATYLNEISGGAAELLPTERLDMRLPVYISRSYELLAARFFDRSLLLAVQRERVQGQSPMRLRSDHEALLRAAPGAFVVLVLDELPSYLRRRLIEAGIPFVVPGRQIFLPTMLVDLRERQPRPAPDTAEHLGWAAQVVVLRHLLHGDIEEQNLAGVASVCGYTAMAISNAQRQLVDVDLAVLRKVGRSKHLVFGESGPGIWKRALPLLRRPWRRRHPVTVEGKGPHTWIAGLEALARETMIASDNVATVAMAARDLRSSIADRTFTVCAAIDEADVLVEAWEYDPGRLAAGKIIDPLSLYLCLKDEPDERVQIALEQHMDALEW